MSSLARKTDSGTRDNQNNQRTTDPQTHTGFLLL